MAIEVDSFDLSLRSTETGERLNNHITVSTDNGKTFSAPIDTGVRGQASSIIAIGGANGLKAIGFPGIPLMIGLLLVSCIVNLFTCFDIALCVYCE